MNKEKRPAPASPVWKKTESKVNDTFHYYQLFFNVLVCESQITSTFTVNPGCMRVRAGSPYNFLKSEHYE